METTEIILRENGTLTERVIRERDLATGPAVLDALTETVTRTLRDVLSLPEWGLVHASVGLNDTLWTVAIDRIPLHARFRLINGVLVPAFASGTDLELPLVYILSTVALERYQQKTNPPNQLGKTIAASLKESI